MITFFESNLRQNCCHYKSLIRPKLISVFQVARTDRLHCWKSTDYLENIRAFPHEGGINKELRFQSCFSEARPCFCCNI